MKKFNVLHLALSLLLMASCNNKPEGVFDSLTNICGQEGSGQVIYPEGDDNPFKGATLFMKIEYCGKDSLRIPFHVGEDRSRTWILTRSEKGILLKHDHRHEDGTPDEVTMYGGWSNHDQAAGMALHFPADDYTGKLLPAAATNEWVMKLSDDQKIFSYILYRDGELRFHADFTL